MALERPLEIAAFLEEHQWDEAAADPVTAGLSSRRYARLTRQDGHTAILMDADTDQKTPQFVIIDKILRKLGIDAPEIYAADAAHGLVLMQDFGHQHIGDLLDTGAQAKDFYFRATDILIALHRQFNRTDISEIETPYYSCELLAQQAVFFLDVYFPYMQNREATEDERRDFASAWQVVMHPLEGMPKSLMLRDFMANNLMDLPNGKIGVLDFQDAGMGCIAYDLASLCEETRRDGGFTLLPEIIDYYHEKSGSALSKNDLMRACTIMSAQRHTRFLNTITLMATQKGRRTYLDYVPRIRRHLKHILNKPYLLPVREWIERYEGLL
jgi:aminoglycoside/choline kinase family phosphotransferase